MSKPTRFPLAWPKGRPRRKAADRVNGSFSMKVEGKERKVNIVTACERLEDQVDRLGGIYPILSTNQELRMDGRPRADRLPADPGACVYFQMGGEPYALACDTFTDLAQNIAALAAHVEATRRIERYGVASAKETLQAFSALPPPAGEGIIRMPQATPSRPWWEFFGVIRDTCDADTVQALYRAKAKKAEGAGLLDLNLARDAAMTEIEGRGA